MRRPEPLDPAVERDLAALDAALAGEPDADAELALLVRRRPCRRPATRRRGSASASTRAQRRPPRRRRSRPRPVARATPAGPRPGARASSPRRSSQSSSPAARGEHGGSARPRGPARPPERADRLGRGQRLEPAAASAARPSPRAPRRARPAPGRRVERTVDARPRRAGPAASTRSPTASCARPSARAASSPDSQMRRTGSRGTATFVLRIPAARLDAAVRRPQPPRPRALDRAGGDRPHRGDGRHRRAPARRPHAAPRARRRARDGVGRARRPSARRGCAR